MKSERVRERMQMWGQKNLKIIHKILTNQLNREYKQKYDKFLNKS